MVKKGLSLNMPGVEIDVDAALAEKAGAGTAPAEEKKETAPKEVKTKPKRTTKIFTPKQEKELRNVAVNLRVKKRIKDDFDLICKRLGRSQSDMLEFWVDYTMAKMITQDNK